MYLSRNTRLRLIKVVDQAILFRYILDVTAVPVAVFNISDDCRVKVNLIAELHFMNRVILWRFQLEINSSLYMSP